MFASSDALGGFKYVDGSKASITARRLVLPGDLQGRSRHVDLDLDDDDDDDDLIPHDDMKISYMLDPISI